MARKRGMYRKLKSELKAIHDDSPLSYIKRPTLQMSGNRELFAEGVISVEVYNSNSIIFNASGVKLSINGKGLAMCFYNRNTVKITGFFESICFE